MKFSHPEDKVFTGTQVGAVLESIRRELSLLAEGQTALRTDVDQLKKDVGELKDDMRVVKDVIRIAIPSINAPLSALEAKAG